MDATRYLALKARGLVTLAKVGSAYASEVKRFSGETGVAIEPEVEAIDAKVLAVTRKAHVDAIAAIDAFVADLTKLG